MRRTAGSALTPRPGALGGSRVAVPRGSGLGAAALLVLPIVAACATARGPEGGALEPRFVAVHNALAAMGLAQIGPIQQGTLGEGREARVTLTLPAGCVTVAALGGEGVHDIDATLLDPRGTPLAHDTTNEPQAVLRPCLDAPDTYTLVVHFASGAGPWLAATWAGGAPSGPASSAVASSATAEANGTCEAPIPLTPGTVNGSTTHGGHENVGSCGPSDSRELVYELDVPERQRVSIEVEARFDSVLYLRKDDCTDANAEIDCSDDAPDRNHSRIERVLEPGKYFVFVDGYSQESGPFKLTVNASNVLALADVCRRAPLLPIGAPRQGSTEGMADDAQATCGNGAEGADAAWRMELPARARVRVAEHSDDMSPVVHVRRACSDEQSEVACGDSGAATGDATITGVFEPGAYAVFADAHDRDTAGHYTLSLETAPPAGSGTGGDGCGDAAPLVGAGGAMTGAVTGDTFAARDDVTGSCGGAGAADVVYRFDVAKRSRFVASLDSEEAPHVLVLWRRCGERSAEIACARSIDEVIAPGTYFVAVDGTAPEALGRFTLSWTARDLGGQTAACASPTTLVDGRTISGTTAGAGDRFVASCTGNDTTAGGPDRVFKIVLGKRSTIRVAVTAPAFDAAIALRKECVDAPSGTPLAELACEADADGSHRTTIEAALDPGTYWVVVDGQSPNDQGAFTLDYRVVR